VNIRQERVAATRNHRVDTGLRLAGHTGPLSTSINLIVERAQGWRRARSFTTSPIALRYWWHG